MCPIHIDFNNSDAKRFSSASFVEDKQSGPDRDNLFYHQWSEGCLHGEMASNITRNRVVSTARLRHRSAGRVRQIRWDISRPDTASIRNDGTETGSTRFVVFLLSGIRSLDCSSFCFELESELKKLATHCDGTAIACHNAATRGSQPLLAYGDTICGVDATVYALFYFIFNWSIASVPGRPFM